MQITIWEIADCLTEEELLKYRKELSSEIEIFNRAIELKMARLENLKIKEPITKE
jgi:hypothetical protein